jgi:hypothetical protein
MSMKNQIKRIFKKHSKKLFNREIIDDDYLSDGEIYRNLVQNKKITTETCTFLMNIDGISLCDKSKQSMWPVIFVIIELPKEIRYCLQNVIIAGT